MTTAPQRLAKPAATTKRARNYGSEPAELSALERLMWRLDSEPTLSSGFALLTMVDKTPSIRRLRRRMSYTASVIPRFAMVLDSAKSPTRWVPCEDFDIKSHVYSVTAEASDDETLHELAVEILSEPFDPDLPLWKFVVIKGLGRGRSAIVQKFHHAVTDGEGGLRMSELFVDLDRDAEDPDPLPRIPRAEIDGEDETTRTHWFTSALVKGVQGTTKLVVGGASEALETVFNPKSLIPKVSLAAKQAGEIGELAASSLRVRAPLWSGRGGTRKLDTVEIGLDELRAAGKRLGGTINDVYATATVIAIAKVHAEAGRVRKKVWLAMPISSRRSGSLPAANAFTFSRTGIEVHNSASDQFAAVREAISRTKNAATDPINGLIPIAASLPGPIVRASLRSQGQTIDAVVSNVRGAPVELYMAGAKITAMYPLGPLSGCPANLTALSYAGRFDIGMVCDSAAIDDTGAFRDALEAALAGLVTNGE